MLAIKLLAGTIIGIFICLGDLTMNTYRFFWQFLLFLSLGSPTLFAMEIPQLDQPIVDRELVNFFFNRSQDERIAFVNEKIGIKSNPIEKNAQASMPKSNKQPMTYQSINQEFEANIKFLNDKFISLKNRHSNEQDLFSENKLRNMPIRNEAQLRLNHAQENKISTNWILEQLREAKNIHQAQFKRLPLPQDQFEFELARQEESSLGEKARALCDQILLWHNKAIEEASATPKNVLQQPQSNAPKGPMRMNSNMRTKPYPSSHSSDAPTSHSSQFSLYPSY